MSLLYVIESSLFLLSGHLFYLRDNPLIDSSLVTRLSYLGPPQPLWGTPGHGKYVRYLGFSRHSLGTKGSLQKNQTGWLLALRVSGNEILARKFSKFTVEIDKKRPMVFRHKRGGIRASVTFVTNFFFIEGFPFPYCIVHFNLNTSGLSGLLVFNVVLVWH